MEKQADFVPKAVKGDSNQGNSAASCERCHLREACDTLNKKDDVSDVAILSDN